MTLDLLIDDLVLKARALGQDPISNLRYLELQAAKAAIRAFVVGGGGLVEAVQKLSPGADDVIVVTCRRGTMSQNAFATIKQAFPTGTKIVVVTDDMRVDQKTLAEAAASIGLACMKALVDDARGADGQQAHGGPT